MSSLEKNLLTLIRKATKQDGATDISAHVLRVDGSTAWVHIDGGVDETPVERTIDCSTGDTVRVRLAGGQAYIIGNNSAPPTDDTTAIIARDTANTANLLADTAKRIAGDAQDSATIAAQAAAQAESDAQSASAAAAVADGKAVAAANAASAAQSSATAAQNSANAAANAASVADGKAVAAGNAASAAQSSANAARASADNAGEYASRALGNLSTVQSVAETLTWITQHGTMTLTSDVTIDPTHVYFVIDPNGDYTVGGTTYSIVSDPKASELNTYYELSIDESLNNYVATHLALDSEGLWIIPVVGGFKVLIATGSGNTYTMAGTYIVDGNGNTVAMFAANAITLGNRKAGSTIGNRSQVYGTDCTASGSNSRAGGTESVASGIYSYAEGYKAIASGPYSNAKGYETKAQSYYSTAEGYQTRAAGSAAHSEGHKTYAGSYAHAEGYETEASTFCTHAGGEGTYAGYYHQTTIGRFNDNQADTLFEVGNGTSVNARSNAFEVYDTGRFGTPGLWFSVNASGEPCVTFEDGN